MSDAAPPNPFREFVAWMQLAHLEKGLFLGLAKLDDGSEGRLRAEGHAAWTRRNNERVIDLYTRSLRTATTCGYPVDDGSRRVLAARSASASLLMLSVGPELERVRSGLVADIEAANAREEGLLRPLAGHAVPDALPPDLVPIREARHAAEEAWRLASAPLRGEWGAVVSAMEEAARGLDPLVMYLETHPEEPPAAKAEVPADAHDADTAEEIPTWIYVGFRQHQLEVMKTLWGSGRVTAGELRTAVYKRDKGVNENLQRTVDRTNAKLAELGQPFEIRSYDGGEVYLLVRIG